MSKKLLSVVNLDFNTVLQKQINQKPVIYNKGTIINHNEKRVPKTIMEESLNAVKRTIMKAPVLYAKKSMMDVDLDIIAKEIIDPEDESKFIGNILANAGVFTKEEIEQTAKEIKADQLKFLEKEKDIRLPSYMSKTRPKTAKVTSRLYQPKKIYYNPEDFEPKNKTKSKSKSRSKSKPKQSNLINPFNEEAGLIPSQAGNNNQPDPQELDESIKPITEKELAKTIKHYQMNNDTEKKILTMVNQGILSKGISNAFSKAPKTEMIKLNSELTEAFNKKANEDMERTGAKCTELLKRTKDIDFQMKNDIKELHQIPLKKQFDESKGLMVIDEVKKDIITAPTFDINNLNGKDKKLMTSKLNYHPKKREPAQNLRHTDEKYANFVLKNDDLLTRSSETIKHIQSKRTKVQKQITKSEILNERNTALQSKKEVNDYIGSAYGNLYNKGKKLSVKEIKQELNKEIDTKEDLYDYVYLKEKETPICYYHPFLADGGML